MAVLVEAYSVLIRCSAAERSIDGGMAWLVRMCLSRNDTYCCDNELARIGFLTSYEAEAFARELEGRGLTFLHDGKAIDIVIADQQAGFNAPCHWAEVGTITLQGGPVKCARLMGSTQKQAYMPDGWQRQGSLSEKFLFLPIPKRSRD